MQQPTLQTTRLTLRPLSTADAADVYEFVSDPRVTRFMPYERHTCIDTVIEWLRFVETDDSEWNFAMVRKADGKVIGCSSIGPDAHVPGAYGFGYNIRHDCWNQSYTTEATRAMIAYCRDTLGIERFASNHAAENPASGRVMEKCGLQYVHDITITSFNGSRSFPGKFYIGTAASTRMADRPQPVIESDRLQLRPFAEADAPDVFLWAQDEQITRYLSWNPHASAEVSRQWIASIQNSENPRIFAVIRKADGRPIGCMDIRPNPDAPAQFGYLIRRDC